MATNPLCMRWPVDHLFAAPVISFTTTAGLRPHPEAESAVAMSAFRAALDEGWGTDATTDDDDDDNNEKTQMQWKQQQKPQGKRKAGVSSSSSKGEAYVNRRGSTGGPSTSIRGPLTGGSGSPSGSATGTTASATTTTTTTSARHPARAAFRSVARTLGDAGLGWGYGALHATLEVCACHGLLTCLNTFPAFSYDRLSYHPIPFKQCIRSSCILMKSLEKLSRFLLSFSLFMFVFGITGRCGAE